MGRQVTLKSDYQPLIAVKDIPCWPSEPLYDQIVQGEELKAQGINLESFWTPWQSVETRTLRAVDDFDQVVLGIAVGSLRFICPSLWKPILAGKRCARTLARFRRWQCSGGFIRTLQVWGGRSRARSWTLTSSP